MSWVDQEFEELQVGDKVRTVNGVEASVVVLDSDEVVIKYHHDGSHQVIKGAANMHVYERDGKPYPVAKEIDCIRESFPDFICYEVVTYEDTDLGVAVWLVKDHHKCDIDYKYGIDSAPRYKGFVGYVYKTTSGDYGILSTPSTTLGPIYNVTNKVMVQLSTYTTRHPLAVLFEK